jgi:hypothetical protein
MSSAAEWSHHVQLMLQAAKASHPETVRLHSMSITSVNVIEWVLL